jgi:hypothetical protein
MPNQQAVQIIENFSVHFTVRNLGFYYFIFINKEHKAPAADRGHDFVHQPIELGIVFRLLRQIHLLQMRESSGDRTGFPTIYGLDSIGWKSGAAISTFVSGSSNAWKRMETWEPLQRISGKAEMTAITADIINGSKGNPATLSSIENATQKHKKKIVMLPAGDKA